MRKIFGLVCIGVSAWLVFSFWRQQQVNHQGPSLSPAMPVVATATSMPSQAMPTETIEILPVQEFPTNTALPVIPTSVFNGFSAGGIDFDSGKPMAMALNTDNGQAVYGRWSKATGPNTDPGGVAFQDPHNGSVFMMKATDDGTPVLFAHTGQVYNDWMLFASNLDLYVRKDGENYSSLAQGIEKVSALVGNDAYLCQTEKEMLILSAFDGNCPGTLSHLKVSAASLILQDQVDQYSYAVDKFPLSWLMGTLVDASTGQPSTSFQFINTNNGLLLTICIQRFPDQVPDSHSDAGANRLAVYLEFVQ